MTVSRSATRSVLLAVALGFVSAAACVDESVLENEECQSNDDCFRTQECVGTGYPTTEPVGWCRPKGDGCVEGSQPGCACEVDGIQLCCNSTIDYTLVPHRHPTEGCVCVFPDDPQFPADPDEMGGCINASG